MRAAILYVAGFGALAFGFYQFWRDGSVYQQTFITGGICIACAAALQIVRDLWKRLGR